MCTRPPGTFEVRHVTFAGMGEASDTAGIGIGPDRIAGRDLAVARRGPCNCRSITLTRASSSAAAGLTWLGGTSATIGADKGIGVSRQGCHDPRRANASMVGFVITPAICTDCTHPARVTPTRHAAPHLETEIIFAAPALGGTADKQW
jgi:hypothetical protein